MRGQLASQHARVAVWRWPSPALVLLTISALGLVLLLATFLLSAGSRAPRGTPPLSGPQTARLRHHSTTVAPTMVAQALPNDAGGLPPMRYTAWRAPTADAGLMMPAVGPDGRVWVGAMTANTLTVLTPQTGGYEAFAYQGSRPTGTMGVVVDGVGRVWLAQDEVHALGEFDPATGDYRQLPTPTPNAGPTGIALDRTGRVWVSELGAHAIAVYDPTAGQFTEYPIGDANVYPYWLSIAPDGRVWFTNINGGSIGVLDPTTGQVQAFAVPGARSTTGITVGGDGTVWFGVQGGALGRLAPDSMQPTTVPLPSGSAYGVALDPQGMVWVATSQAVVYRFDPSTGRFGSVSTGPGAWWLTTTGDGTVWVVEGTGDGNALGRIAP